MDVNDRQQDGPDEPRPEDQPTEPTAEQAPTEGPRRLTRSRGDRVIGGVCGGLGRYFNVDPIIFRIGAVALAFAGGASILIYLAMLLLVPSDDAVDPQGAAAPERNRPLVIEYAIAGPVSHQLPA